MPTLPLYEPNPIADASHRVRAPGGYEWWYFDAEDPKTDTQLVAIFFEGFVFHPGYLRAFKRYVKRPTKTSPPVGADFPCAYFVVYRNGRILHQFMTQYRRDQLQAASDRVAVAIGPNTLAWDDGAMRLHLEGSPWKLAWQGPRTLNEQKLSADLSFAPRFHHPADERVFLSRAMTGAGHHWVLANPSCDVKGAIKLGDETIDFTGRGYHDHNYGTAPIGPGLKRWMWGRVIADDSVLTFHYALPRRRVLPPELHLVRAAAATYEQLNVPVDAKWSRRSRTGLAYPVQVRFGDVMTLSDPRVIDASPFYLRLQYRASTGPDATAFCEIAYPHRLRWPVLGRMIEMSIDQRELSKHAQSMSS